MSVLGKVRAIASFCAPGSVLRLLCLQSLRSSGLRLCFSYASRCTLCPHTWLFQLMDLQDLVSML